MYLCKRDKRTERRSLKRDKGIADKGQRVANECMSWAKLYLKITFSTTDQRSICFTCEQYSNEREHCIEYASCPAIWLLQTYFFYVSTPVLWFFIFDINCIAKRQCKITARRRKNSALAEWRGNFAIQWRWRKKEEGMFSLPRWQGAEKEDFGTLSLTHSSGSLSSIPFADRQRQHSWLCKHTRCLDYRVIYQFRHNSMLKLIHKLITL